MTNTRADINNFCDLEKVQGQQTLTGYVNDNVCEYKIRFCTYPQTFQTLVPTKLVTLSYVM